MERVPYRATDAAAAYSGLRLPVSILLHDVRSMYNVGAFFRAADGAGCAANVLHGVFNCPDSEMLFYFVNVDPDLLTAGSPLPLRVDPGVSRLQKLPGAIPQRGLAPLTAHLPQERVQKTAVPCKHRDISAGKRAADFLLHPGREQFHASYEYSRQLARRRPDRKRKERIHSGARQDVKHAHAFFEP